MKCLSTESKALRGMKRVGVWESGGELGSIFLHVYNALELALLKGVESSTSYPFTTLSSEAYGPPITFHSYGGVLVRKSGSFFINLGESRMH